jgi:gliding motility-associated-like protein
MWSNGTITRNTVISSSGSFSVVTSSINGCISNSSLAIPVVVNTLPPVPLISASGPLAFCSGGSVRLTSSASSNNNWSDGSTTQSVDISNDGQYYVTVINNNECESTSALLEVIVNEAPLAEAGPDQELNFTFETQMNGMISESDQGEWSVVTGSGHLTDVHSPSTKINSLGMGENIFLWTVKNEFCESSDEVKITVINQFVPNVITPNGDGKNDYFKISEYPGKARLIIINRWGNEEFSDNDYQNNWNGRSNKGNELPEDTYFYILMFDNGKTLKGSVLIKR